MTRLTISVLAQIILMKTSLCLMQDSPNSTHGYQDTTKVQHSEDKDCFIAKIVDHEKSVSLMHHNSNSREEKTQDTTNATQSEEKDSSNLEMVARENSRSFFSNCLKPKTYIFGSILLFVGCVPFAALFIVKRYYAKQNYDFPYNHFENESGTVCHV